MHSSKLSSLTRCAQPVAAKRPGRLVHQMARARYERPRAIVGPWSCLSNRTDEGRARTTAGDPEWTFEIKWDGMRASHVSIRPIRLLKSLVGQPIDITHRFPELGELAQSMGAHAR